VISSNEATQLVAEAVWNICLFWVFWKHIYIPVAESHQAWRLHCYLSKLVFLLVHYARGGQLGDFTLYNTPDLKALH
jgi:hypothetical protein